MGVLVGQTGVLVAEGLFLFEHGLLEHGFLDEGRLDDRRLDDFGQSDLFFGLDIENDRLFLPQTFKTFKTFKTLGLLLPFAVFLHQ